jgi:MYXO-CTERM domain-containing protein
LPDLPSDLPGGRQIMVNTSMPIVQPRMNDLGSNSGALPVDEDDGGCNVQAGSSSAPRTWALFAGAALALAIRRRSRPRC